MTAEEMGLTSEAVDYIEAIIYSEENCREEFLIVPRAIFRVSSGVGDEDDFRILKEYEAGALSYYGHVREKGGVT